MAPEQNILNGCSSQRVNNAAMVEWLRCLIRIYKMLRSNLDIIIIHGMILDKPLTAKWSRMIYSRRAHISSASTPDGRGTDTAACKKKNKTVETGCIWILIITAADPNVR